MRATVLKKLFRLIRDEKAQATTEYILLLVAVLGFAMLIYQKLLRPWKTKLGAFFSKRLENALGGGNFHYFPVGKK